MTTRQQSRQNPRRKSANRMWRRELPGNLRSVYLSPVDHQAVLGFEDGTVQFVNPNGEVIWEAEVGPPIKKVGILPVKKRVMVLDEYSRLTAIDFSGKVIFQKDFDAYWSSFEIKSGNLILWGWKSPPIKVSATGKILKTLNLPHPWRRLRAGQKKELFWTVHNEMCVGLYNAHGANLWLVNPPHPVDLSREHASDLVVDDSGEVLAISCHDKGVYLFNSAKRTLNQIELESNVHHIAISGDGNNLLLSDGLNNIYCVSSQAHVLWQTELDSKATHLCMDRKGTRLLAAEENGMLTCYRFAGREDKRSQFLELTDLHEVSDQRELWKHPLPSTSVFKNVEVTFAPSGTLAVLGGSKEYRLFDSGGQDIGTKSFMVPFRDVVPSSNGKKVFWYQPNEVVLMDVASRHEKSLGFYQMPLREYGVDPKGNGFLLQDIGNNLSLYSATGKQMWNRAIKKPMSKIELDASRQMAAFQGAPRTVYSLDLKRMKTKHTVLGGPVNCLRLLDSGIYVGGKAGRGHALDEDCKIRWKFKIDQPIEEIIELGASIAFCLKGGETILYDTGGREQARFRRHHARSILVSCAAKILELVPRNDGLSCYQVPSGDLLWRLPLASRIRSLAASGTANRVMVLDGTHLSCYQIVQESDQLEKRGSYLEI